MESQKLEIALEKDWRGENRRSPFQTKIQSHSKIVFKAGFMPGQNSKDDTWITYKI